MAEVVTSFHGLPGIGVSGNRGATGKAGTGVYFGFINDFFDSNFIPIDTFMRDAVNVNTLSAKTFNGKKYYTGVIQYIDKYGIDVNSSSNVDKESTDFEDLNAEYSSLEDTSLTIGGDTFQYSKLYLTRYDSSMNKWIPKTNILVDMSAVPYEYDAENNPESGYVNSSAYGVDIVMWNGSVQMYHDSGKYLHASKDPYAYVRSAVKYVAGEDEDALVDNNGVSYKDDQADNAYIQDLNEIAGAVQGNTFYDNDDDYSKLNLSNIDSQDTDHFNFVKWTDYDYEKMRVPTNLSSKYVEGDVLYVYLDEDAFNNRGMKYTHMIVVTADMVGKSFSYVLDNLTVTDPLSMSNFDESIDSSRLRVSLTKKLTVGSYEGEVGTLKDVFFQNFNETVSGSNYQLQVTEFNQGNETKFLKLAGSSDGGDSSLCFGMHWTNKCGCNVEDVEHFTVSSDSTLKLSSAWFNQDAITNFELEGVVKPKSLRQYGSFSYTFTDDDFSADYQSMKYGFNIDKSKVLSTASDDFNALVGAYVVDRDAAPRSNSTKDCLDPEDMFIPLDVSIKDDGRLYRDGGYHYIVVPYAAVMPSGKYFGQPTYVTIANSEDDLEDLEVYVTIEEDAGKQATSTVESTSASSPITFLPSGQLTAEANSSINLAISAPDDVSITGVWINGIDISEAMASGVSDVTFASWISGTVKDLQEFTFEIDDNLPNVNGVDYETFDEYMKSGCSEADGDPAEFFILKQSNMLYSSSSRSILITVTYTEDGVTEKKAHYELEQPGFKDPRAIPQVTLTPMVSQPELEAANSDANSVMANQFQWFVDISIDGFGRQGWTKYSDDVSVDLTIESDWTNYEMLTDYNYPILQTYPVPCIKIVPDDISIYTDSSVDTSAWIDNYVSLEVNVVDGSVSSSSTMAELEADAKALANGSSTWSIVDSSYRHMSSLDAIQDGGIGFVATSGKECVLFDSSLLKEVFVNPGMNWSGLDKHFKVELHGLTPEMLNNKSHVKLQVILEEGNPIPTCLSMNFKVTEVKVHYEGTLFDCVDDYDNSVELLSTVKNKNQATEYVLPSMMTEMQQFFINPLSFVAAPSALEEGAKFSGDAVKIYGSADEIKIGSKLYGERALYKLYNDSRCSTYSTRAENQYVNWHAWQLKVGYLQDDIADVSIFPRDPFEMLANAPSVDPFKHATSKWNDGMAAAVINWNNSEEKVWRPFESEEKYSQFDEMPYLAVTYNSTLMKAKKRDDVSTFYYNNELYEADRYSQFNYNSPAFLNTGISISMRDSSLLTSMEVWNYEFEVASGTDKKLASPGVISTYSDGYMLLDASADTSQYSEDEALSLAETKSKNEPWILVDWTSTAVQQPSKSKEWIPESGKWFRTLAYDLAWQCPAFDNEETFYAYDIMPAFYGMLDAEFVSLAHKKAEELGYDVYDDAKPYNEWIGEVEGELAGELNIANSAYSKEVTKRYMSKKWSSATGQMHNMVPYTYTYNIYPRILHNNDFGTTNVLMLRAPSIRDNFSQTLDVTYFSLEDLASRERCVQPYNLF